MYCHKDSAVETFTKDTNITYKYIGDMDSSKELTDSDAVTMLEYADGTRTVNETDINTKALLDYDLDGEITVLDTIKMLNDIK